MNSSVTGLSNLTNGIHALMFSSDLKKYSSNIPESLSISSSFTVHISPSLLTSSKEFSAGKSSFILNVQTLLARCRSELYNRSLLPSSDGVYCIIAVPQSEVLHPCQRSSLTELFPHFLNLNVIRNEPNIGFCFTASSPSKSDMYIVKSHLPFPSFLPNTASATPGLLNVDCPVPASFT